MGVILDSNRINRELTLSEQDSMYIETIEGFLTLHGQLPYSIPKLMIINMIKRAAQKFYKYYYNALTKSYMLITKEDLLEAAQNLAPNQTQFHGYRINLHPSIRVVNAIHESNIESPMSVTDIVYTLAWGASPQYYNQSMIGINTNLYITEYACKMVEINAMNSIFSEGIPYRYNPNEHVLIIFKEIKHNIVLEVDRDIPLHNLYNDELFDTYVVALCRAELKRMIGSHTMQLPGDVTVNVDELCAGCNEDIQQVDEILKNGSGTGDLIYFRR